MFCAANKILNNELEAEDAVHQAFVKIAENIDKVPNDLSAKTKSFVVTIVENTAIDRYRKLQKHGNCEIQAVYTIGYIITRKLTQKTTD